MKKYQLVDTLPDANNAGSKAKEDVANIAEELGYQRINLVRKLNNMKNMFASCERQISYIVQWSKFYNRINKNSILLLQFPFLYAETSRSYVLKKLKRKKNVKIVILIHDVEELRKIYFDKHNKQEFDLYVPLADQIIVHNLKMKKFFIEKGYDANKLINLQIFDYLIPNEKNKEMNFSKNIIIAGNLDTDKVGYLKEIHKVNTNFILYGSNYNLLGSKNIDYRGSVLPYKLPNLLKEGFGLVWDGNRIDKCDGPFGNYLRYNDPHKLSLYLASGLPVFIWDKAAEAKFVEKYGLGYTISSLYDIPYILGSISEQEYNQLITNVNKISQKLTKGYFLRTAMKEAYDRLNSDLK